MNREQFREFLNELVEKEYKLNMTKGREYAKDEDVLSNFKSAAEDLGVTPWQAWGLYFKKHVDAILNYCRTGRVLSESLLSRILDARLYLALLAAMEQEQASSSKYELQINSNIYSGTITIGEANDGEGQS